MAPSDRACFTPPENVCLIFGCLLLRHKKLLWKKVKMYPRIRICNKLYFAFKLHHMFMNIVYTVLFVFIWKSIHISITIDCFFVLYSTYFALFCSKNVTFMIFLFFTYFVMIKEFWNLSGMVFCYISVHQQYLVMLWSSFTHLQSFLNHLRLDFYIFLVLGSIKK